MVVSVEDAFWVTECVFLSGQLPDDDGFVCRVQGLDTESGPRPHGLICIPREAVRIMSGFSEEVAMAVTHPA